MMDGEDKVIKYIRGKQDSLVGLLRELIRFPSVNRGRDGDEYECQRYVARIYGELGLEVDLYSPDSVPGIESHPGYWPGRNYRMRPNVAGIFRSSPSNPWIMLAAHADVVPEGGPDDWTHGPFSGAVAEGKIYGRGACDDKYAIAASFFAVKAILSCGIPLRRNVCLSSVVDEENGGGNGSLAACLRHPCGEYIYLDGPEKAAVAGVGGGIARIGLSAAGDVFTASRVHEGIRLLLAELEGLGKELAREMAADPTFAGSECARNPLRLYSVSAGDPSGTGLNRGEVSFAVYTLESKAVTQQRLGGMIGRLNTGTLGELGVTAGDPVWTTRFFEKTAVSPESRVVAKYRRAYRRVTGRDLPVGSSVLSDYYLYNNYGGGQAFMTGLLKPFSEPESFHQANESVDIEKVVELACALAAYLLDEGE